MRAIAQWFGHIGNQLSDALNDFVRGLSYSIGIELSIFNLILLLIGLTCLAIGLRSLWRTALISAAIWLAVGAIVIGWLIR